MLETGSFMLTKHRSILLNLFDLENITVDDVMIPAAASKRSTSTVRSTTSCISSRPAITINSSSIRATSIACSACCMCARRCRRCVTRNCRDTLRELLAEPYFVPAGTPVFQQLQFFQKSGHRIAIVVDEYGELQGLVTPEDIIEELIGEFTTTIPRRAGSRGGWDENGECIVAGSMPLRELNR